MIRDNMKTEKSKINIDELLNEIGHTPLLDAEKEMALIRAIQTKSSECDEMERLVWHNLRYVVSVAAQYQNRGQSLEELIEAGTEGLRKAAMKYNFKNDVKFMSYAVWWVRQAILQELESHQIEEQKHDTIKDANLRMIVRYGFVNDESGEVVVPCQWHGANDFAEGLAGVQDADEKWGYIDKSRNEVIPCQWEDFTYFSDGFAEVQDTEGNWFKIDKTGEFVHK